MSESRDETLASDAPTDAPDTPEAVSTPEAANTPGVSDTSDAPERSEARDEVAAADEAQAAAPQSGDEGEGAAAEGADQGAPAKKPKKRKQAAAADEESSEKLFDDSKAGPDPEPAVLALQVEAALMVTDKPLTVAKLSEVVGGVRSKLIQDAIASLNEVYESTGRSFRIEQVAGGFQILTQPEHAAVVEALTRKTRESRLTPAQLETLAIIAYKQPILRAEIETIRGVACGETIRVLMDRHLVKIVGRADEIGRPMLYGTTKAFLQTFGLNSIKDLPKAEELRPKS